jgi:hypothetical protein
MLFESETIRSSQKNTITARHHLYQKQKHTEVIHFGIYLKLLITMNVVSF